jgi:hypothetical protein
MKKKFVLLLLSGFSLLYITPVFAQVGIGTTTPHASSRLEISSTNSGILIPRMTTAERTAITNPAKGLLAFDNTTSSFWFHNGTGWIELAGGGSANFWSQNGTNVFNTNAGFVGLGTNNPASVLAIQTPLNSTGFTHTAGAGEIVVKEAIGGISASLGTSTNHPFRLNSNDESMLHLYPTGEVVVGTNTTGAFGKLTVETTNNNYGISHTSVEGNILATRIGGTSAGIGTFSSTNMRLFANGTSAMIIDAANGNIGVGTDAPTAKLHVGGSLKIDNFNTLEFGAGIAGKEANAGKIGYGSFTPDALDILGAGTDFTNRKIKLWNEGGAEFTGNIGIGTASTFGVRLHINQDVEALRLSGNQPYMTFFNGADYKGYVRSIGAHDMEMGTGTGNTNGKLNLSIRGIAFLTVQNDGKVSVNGPAGNFQSPAFTVNGNFGMKGSGGTEWTQRPLSELQLYRDGEDVAFLDQDGDWNTPSDVRLKENFQDYKPVLTGIKNLRVCTYQYKSDKSGARSFGFIAQNVSQYFDDVVSETTDATGEKMLGLAYSKMGVLAIKAIQEQQEIIEQQQGKIEMLEKKIALIEKLLAEKK